MNYDQVINALSCCSCANPTGFAPKYKMECEKCSLNGTPQCQNILARNALVLLKEKEPETAATETSSEKCNDIRLHIDYNTKLRFCQDVMQHTQSALTESLNDYAFGYITAANKALAELNGGDKNGL